MARSRSKKSDLSFGGYGLKPEEDEKLLKKLDEAGLSAKSIIRCLIRSWINQPGVELPNYSKK